jgi:hypothetical protein
MFLTIDSDLINFIQVETVRLAHLWCNVEYQINISVGVVYSCRLLPRSNGYKLVQINRTATINLDKRLIFLKFKYIYR